MHLAPRRVCRQAFLGAAGKEIVHRLALGGVLLPKDRIEPGAADRFGNHAQRVACSNRLLLQRVADQYHFGTCCLGNIQHRDHVPGADHTGLVNDDEAFSIEPYLPLAHCLQPARDRSSGLQTGRFL